MYSKVTNRLYKSSSYWCSSIHGTPQLSQEQMGQLWELLKSEPSAVEQFLLTVLQPGVGTVDMSDHQLSAAGQVPIKRVGSEVAGA